jgi:hypothetical protein
MALDTVTIYLGLVVLFFFIVLLSLIIFNMNQDTETKKNEENTFFNTFINWMSGGSSTDGS